MQTGITSKPSPIRFGWFSLGHRVIDRGAIFRLPEQQSDDKAFKDYLLKNWEAVEAANDMQDILYNGPDHYISLEKRGNPKSALCYPSSWNSVLSKFSPQGFKRLNKRWEKTPLCHESMGNQQSLYRAILDTYTIVKKQFVEIARGNERLKRVITSNDTQALTTQKAFKEELFHNIGRLNHMVGDLFMPLHLTEHFDWPISPKAKQGIHFFIEDQGLNLDDYQTVINVAKDQRGTTPKDITEQNLKPFILSKMSESYKTLFSIVTTQKEVLAQRPVGTPLNVYKENLAKALKPILLPQIIAAQETLSEILYSAWREAGKPALDQTIKKS